MKRWFSLALVALLLIPVLPIGAAAAEIYEFKPYEMPALLSAYEFIFVPDAEMFLYEGRIEPGTYSVSYVCDGQRYIHDDVVLDFGMNISDLGPGGAPYLVPDNPYTDFEGINLIYVLIEEDGTFSVLAQIVGYETSVSDLVVYTGEFPSQGGFTSIFEDFSAFTGSCVNFVSEVAKTITGSPLLLLTCGFLFLGGGIGIIGRLLERR